MEGIFNLEKLNLMSTEKFPWNFSAIKKALNLFDFNEEDPMRSPMNGFIPCAVQLTRIIGKAIQNHTKESSEDSAEKKARDAFSSSQFNITVDGKKAILEENEKCRILVFFVGGVTLTEVGMLKQLTDIDAIIGGTESVHGNGLIGQICPFLPK